ncbi:uncharacterized protein [Miscanthus floridulus]|uniref:uncharacterized protein n=2 Tax=Miscanthus floridulus TaxID=154761 RepID=UPI0034591480
MAARGVQAPWRPVTLRDFLELGCDSSSDGFRSYPRRLPLVPDADAVLQKQQAAPAPRAEAAAAQQLLRRSPSRSPSSLSLSLFSSVPSSVPGALARISSLSRSFSRRIKEGFWRRRDEGDDDEAANFDDRDSCGFPSPLVSSWSSFDSDESEEDVVTTTTEETTPASERDKATASTSSSSSSADHDRTDAAAADGKKAVADGDSAVGRKKLMGASMVVVEDKQQLSPVSVLDFHFDDDDGEEGSDAGTCSSPAFQFQRCTPPADLQRTKQQVQLLHKIGRYDGGGVVQGIDPVDLDVRFTAATSESGDSADASTRLTTTTSGSSTNSSSSAEATATATRHDDDEVEHQSADHSSLPDHHQEQEEPDDEYRLLARLLEHDAAAAACLDDEVSRVLVLDFFAEGADRLVRSAAGGRPLDDDRSEAAAEALVGAAAEWLRGAGPRWGIGDVVLSGKAALDDLERSRRWMCVSEEERDVGADVEGVVVDALLDELVRELAVLCLGGRAVIWSSMRRS